MDKKIKKELIAKANLLEPVIRIGKSGLTNNVIREIKKQLKKRRLIKIKILKSALEKTNKKIFAKDIAEKTDSELVCQIGFIIVLNKK